IEELIQDSRAPNLYWSLSMLPSPLVDMRPAVQQELTTLPRSFPQLRELEKETLTKEQVSRLIDDLLRLVEKVGAGENPAWLRGLGVGAMVAWNLADAKKALLAKGWTEKRVEQMPPQQVVAIHFVGSYFELCDDMLKWWSVPPWESLEGIEKVEKELKGKM